MRHINIEIQKPNRFKDLLHKIFNRLENLMFSIIQKLPEKMIPHSLMNWMERYTDKRLAELKQQIIRDQWKKIALEKPKKLGEKIIEMGKIIAEEIQ